MEYANLSSINAAANVKRLCKAPSFYRRHENLFASYAAYRKHLERRHRNGLVVSGAVVETPLGLLIDPINFRAWLLGSAGIQHRAESADQRASFG